MQAATGDADALSDVLRLIRLRGCIYFLTDLSAPWGIEMPAGPVAQFHAIVRGGAWLLQADARRPLAAGDVVVFPFGDEHGLADDPATPLVPGHRVLEAQQANRPLFRNGAADVQLLCGHFEFDRQIDHPLIHELPRLLHVRQMILREPGWLDMLTPILVRETQCEAIASGEPQKVMAEFFAGRAARRRG